ncbi:MAG: bifunctional folylpolyglutamate synthase/dihydrofolate synthase [Candidatus Marinimicrobia bacterium]|nr:bifunctional folylpolyglutamate synthase/dihydrofolate synthase [Candidatus Neomarinimicrobiota bacterium]MBT3497102.1 bifunctional folylpolyglutamate synthase/dihydrofolate synthase [Candidatus Neomarinimicrobiota bacterium]MBT3691937.1 bifunctional folylpolyglutamate synthase/dihydrofolate synthase [Candidatus Neomarinimicrobiota bacterium]MBT3732032.1 bifunctional folylpolyglutamate synthase/dihydrofolate synthase [Candidatus Neomarinimicrobiota bacterium]MBT4144204.1 bifunctional folylpo
MNSIDIEKVLSHLYALRRDEIKLGLAHTFQLLEVCGNPQKHFKAIHIAGTNGKGSTGKILASIFRQAGKSVGHYSSPHLIRFNERICINNGTITDAYILNFMSNFKSAISEINATYFEVTTALAFCYFRDNYIELAIVETGLGGRLDSTNVLSPKIVAMTPISLDHREMLGNSIEEIAEEKAGIIKPNVSVISSPQRKSVQSIIEHRSKANDVKAQFIDEAQISGIHLKTDGTYFQYFGIEYFIPIVGEFQATNASLAIEVAKSFNPKMSKKTIQKGLANSHWFGRLQKMSEKPTIYYDVSHNQEGIKKTISSLRQLYSGNIMGIIALKGDKELDLICTEIKNKFDSLVAVSDINGLLLNQNVLTKRLREYEINCASAPSFVNAIDQLKDKLLEEDSIGLIFGSHYIASEVFDYFEFSFDNI